MMFLRTFELLSCHNIRVYSSGDHLLPKKEPVTIYSPYWVCMIVLLLILLHDTDIIDDSEYFTESFPERGSSLLCPMSCSFDPPPQVSVIFSYLFTSFTYSGQKSSFLPFCLDKVNCCPDSTLHSYTKAPWSQTATICSSSLLLRDLSSFQHIWMNKSLHRCYLGSNRSESFFHFIHLFNKYLLMLVPGAGDTTVSKTDKLMLRSLEETERDEWIEICVSQPQSREVCCWFCRWSNYKPKDWI